jgi:hypothetical protein
MTLSKTITDQLERIGATVPDTEAGPAVHVLIHEVIWPGLAFEGSTERTRQLLEDQGMSDVSNWSDVADRDEMPSLYEFRFLQSDSRGSFWDSWESDFPRVDSRSLFPFASDEYYFYFLGDNPDDQTDPLIYSVDHEETEWEPYHRPGLTVSRLLSILEAVEA